MFGGGGDKWKARTPELSGEEPRTQVSGFSPRPPGPLRRLNWEPSQGNCLRNRDPRVCPRREGADPPPLLLPDWENITPGDLLRVSSQSCPESTECPHPCRCRDGLEMRRVAGHPSCVCCVRALRSLSEQRRSLEIAQGGREAYGPFCPSRSVFHRACVQLQRLSWNQLCTVIGKMKHAFPNLKPLRPNIRQDGDSSVWKRVHLLHDILTPDLQLFLRWK